MTKRIAVIGIVGLPSNYGGFETMVDNVTKKLYKSYNFTVYCSSKAYSEKLNSYNNCNLKYINLKANGLQSIFYDFFSMIDAIKHADILLILGISGCIFLPFVKLISNKRIIVNIDGMEWKRPKWNIFVRFFLRLSEIIAVYFADELIADNRAIVKYLRNTYNKSSNFIAYGGDHAKKIKTTSDLKKKYNFISNPYALKVCRIEKENNIEMILKAFSNYHCKNLVVIGNWQNSFYGKNLYQKYMSYENIHLLNSIYDSKILNQIRSNCEIYIHGHSAGGTNPSLVEAMNLGLPIFSFKVSYNIETTANKAKYFNSCEELLELLKKTKEKELYFLGEEMHNIAKNIYSWNKISTEYKNIFEK